MRAVIFALMASSVVAQVAVPTFTPESVLPANERHVRPLQPGMTVSIYGSHLGPDAACTLLKAPPEPGPLCGTEVTVGGVKAALLYVQQKQINLVIPRVVPAEGMLPFVVTHKGRVSRAVSVEFGAEIARMSVIGTARVGRPLWIRLALPGLHQRTVRYPVSIYPSDFRGHDFEVRRNGVDLPKIRPNSVPPMVGGGPVSYGSIGGGGLLGLPREPEDAGRLPLHLMYRFDQPGTYQVRYTGYDLGFPVHKRVLVRSEWLTFAVAPASGAWLPKPAPVDAVELLSDYLPSLLVRTDAEILPLVAGHLYHENHLVRQYTLYALYMFDDDAVFRWTLDALKRRGPVQELAYFLSWRRTLFQQNAVEIADIVIGYLRSESLLILAGALQTLMFLRDHNDWSKSPAVPAKLNAAVLAHADSIRARGTTDVLHVLEEYLRGVRAATPAVR